jgi:hypothetical protein
VLERFISLGMVSGNIGGRHGVVKQSAKAGIVAGMKGDPAVTTRTDKRKA